MRDIKVGGEYTRGRIPHSRFEAPFLSRPRPVRSSNHDSTSNGNSRQAIVSHVHFFISIGSHVSVVSRLINTSGKTV